MKRFFVYSDEEIYSFVKEKLEEFPYSEEDSGGEATRGEDLKRPQGSGKYTRMYLGNEKFDITAANQILINTAEWLIRKGKIDDKLLPVSAGPKRYLLNKENKNKYGGPLPSAKKLSNGYWIMLNLSKDNCIAYAKRLLVRFNVDPEILKLE
ncbi:MAG: hypothetical protein QXU98_05015 [Candidatus Parvarchaeota archaeon]